MRKHKQVQRKDVVYSLDEWKLIEERAASVLMKTGTFIKRILLDGHITYFNVSEVMKALRIIGTSINQIAKKANEINSIYAVDIEKLRKENEEICHTLNQFLSALPSIAA